MIISAFGLSLRLSSHPAARTLVLLLLFYATVLTGFIDMAFNLASASRRVCQTALRSSRTMATQTPTPSTTSAPNTHFKITLRRSAISLGERIQETLVSLGIHRRHQTVYHPHSQVVAGKILRVKELVEVENVPEHLVKTKQQQRQERKAARGYVVVGSKELEL